jgi:hypothetical protein
MQGKREPSSLALMLLATTFLTPAGPAQAAGDGSLGPEVQVNTFTAGSQEQPSLAVDADGDFVVVWTSEGQDGDGSGVFAQRFTAEGAPLGSEFPVNSFTTGDQASPSVAMDADGDFVVTWESFGQDGSLYGVFAQRFDAAGSTQGGEFLVTTSTTNSQRHPSVAMDADGAFVVAWGSSGQDGSSSGIFARRFDATGSAQGAEFQVNTVTTDFQGIPTVAMDADGDFVVTWASYGGQDGSLTGIFAQRFDAAGSTQGLEFQVNTFTSGVQTLPAVAMDADGDFVVAWRSYGQEGYYDGSVGIFAQRFDAAGSAQGLEFRVNTFTTGPQNAPTVAMDADGNFVVAWDSSNQDGDFLGVFAQRFDAAGLPRGPEFQVNTVTTESQRTPSVAMDADGDFVVAWESYGQDGDTWGVFAQRFAARAEVVGDFDGDGKADILWRNTSTGTAILWQMDGFAVEATGSIGGASTDWQIRALADFDADAKTDILWRNTASGAALIWLMDGFERRELGGIGGAGPDWEIAGAGDFDGDDRADILWRNTATGANVVWLMDGLTRTGLGGIGGVPPVWAVAGVGDFDADAKSDILWRNTVSGTNVIWLMDGFAKHDLGSIGAVPPAWEVAGLGTFNSDARSDILWRNTGTGATVIWQMDGLLREDAQSIGAPSTVWRIDGVGDGDGDKRSDILWRNTGNGATLVWRMDGFVVDALGGLGPVPLVWEVQ